MMGGSIAVDDHTAREEAEGKIIWEKLQAKQIGCADLSDDDFEVLGEYFMGQMMGESHSAMNKMMVNMMGEQGEEQMHVVMGKRMSGCEPNASVPQNVINQGIMPMMMGGNNFMMGNWGQTPLWWGSIGSWLVLLNLIIWLIVGVLVVIWLWRQLRRK